MKILTSYYQSGLKRRVITELTAIVTVFITVIALCFVQLYHNIDKENSIPNAKVLEEILQTYPQNIDKIYIENINTVMEQIMSNPTIIGYAFSTPQYLPEHEIFEYIPTYFNSVIDSNPYISEICFYTQTLEDYITPATEGFGMHSNDSLYNDLIYDYNSNSLQAKQVKSGEHLTFCFLWNSGLYFGMDMTTFSGQSHSTLFVKVNNELFNNYASASGDAISTYGIKVYDSFNNVIYNNNLSSKDNNTELMSRLSSGMKHYIVTDSSYFIYNSSNNLGWSFIYEVPRGFSPSTSPKILVYFLVMLIAFILIILSVVLLFIRFILQPFTRVEEILELSDIVQDKKYPLLFSLPDTLCTIVRKIDRENKLLKDMLENTSNEAISLLFSKLLSDQPIDEEGVKLTLRHTNCGFEEHDVYTAGIIDHIGYTPLTMDLRNRILSLITETLKKFTQKYACHGHSYFADEASLFIVLAFPGSTSVAKAKTMIKDLEELLQSSFEPTGLNIHVSFGHIYHSIYDIGFSYNEALRSDHRNYLDKISSSPIALNDGVTDYPAAAPETDDITPENITNDISAESQEDNIIERRAHHIASSIYSSEDTNISSLIDRSVSEILEIPEDNHSHTIQSFINYLIGEMISFPFVNPDFLTDVSDTLYTKLDAVNNDDELKSLLTDTLSTICDDFSNSIKKQRNPYITSALSYIDANYSNSDLSLEEIASELQIAPNYLSTLFSKNLGKKLFEYITEYRLQKSLEMLENTTLNINEISEKSGFGSSRNYIRIFKKYKDTTPGAYRKNHVQMNHQ